jgi:nucleoside-diphosphate-sugar epimerase
MKFIPSQQYSIQDITTIIIENMKLGRGNYIEHTHASIFNDSTCLSNNDKIKALGWSSKVTISNGLAETIECHNTHHNYFGYNITQYLEPFSHAYRASQSKH